jgi:hypothetical protein
MFGNTFAAFFRDIFMQPALAVKLFQVRKFEIGCDNRVGIIGYFGVRFRCFGFHMDDYTFGKNISGRMKS